MTIYICDDEENIRNDVVRKIHKVLPDATIKAFAAGEDLLSAAPAPDLAILDVDMQGINGIETASAIKALNYDTVIIFLTGYEQYMPDAFDVHAYGYILKPIDEAKVNRVICKASDHIKSKMNSDRKCILIKSGSLQRKLLLRDIVYIESFNKKVIIHLENEKIESYARMEDMQNELGSDFYRCHRCYIINMAKVVGYDSSSVILSGDQTIPIAQKKFPQFVKNYLHFAGNRGIDMI